MVNRMKIILIAAAVILGVSRISFAMSCDMGSGSGHGEAHAATTGKGSAVNVGNKICPVGGDTVDGATTYEYQGKVYNFCCPMCIDAFKKNPEKYAAKAEAEAGADHSAHEGHQH